ncbi:MAG: YfcE family phosphodiesterase [Treponema sp.]|jgi:putative phosphoesterase|nr:YfcE family phosphodiesterase [Treponema sp.]
MDSKKLLVFSDTHGSVQTLKTVFDWAKKHSPPNDTICGAAFLGDGISDIQSAANITGFFCDCKFVRGNNDFGYSIPEAIVFDFAENRFFMCHGHHHNLYGGYHTLIAAARNTDANVALFGHSHVPFQNTGNGVLLVNPGSVGRPRSRIGSTFAVIECIEGERPEVEFFGIGAHGEIRKIKV